MADDGLVLFWDYRMPEEDKIHIGTEPLLRPVWGFDLKNNDGKNGEAKLNYN